MSLRNIARIQPASILDIGANIGGFYHEARAVWPEASFYLIEGNPACRPYLEQTGQPFSIAFLAESGGHRNLWKRKGGGTDTGNGFYRELTQFFADDQVEQESVATFALRGLMPDAAFDLCKLDVQGAELDVIRGGLEIIKRAKHVLMEASFERYNEGAPMSDEVFTFMEGIGFDANEVVGDIIHPITRKLIQKDILFSRR